MIWNPAVHELTTPRLQGGPGLLDSSFCRAHALMAGHMASRMDGHMAGHMAGHTAGHMAGHWPGNPSGLGYTSVL